MKMDSERLMSRPVLAMGLMLMIVILGGCIVGEKPLRGPRGAERGQGSPMETGSVQLAGQRCPPGAYVIGFDAHGKILCSQGTPSVPEEIRTECPEGANLGPRAKLQLCNLSGRTLTGSNLQQANLLLANFESSNLSGANLSSTHLSGANLRSANLEGANLRGVVGLKAKKNGDATESRATDFTAAILQKADFTGAFLIGAKFQDAVWGNTICPDGRNSDEDDGDGGTCTKNLVAMGLTIEDNPPIGKGGVVTNRFSIAVDAALVCVIVNEDGSVANATEIERFTVQPGKTHSWSGTCPTVPPQRSHITVTAAPHLS